MNALVAGAAAGMAATVPMTAVMKRMHRALPPGERYPLPPRIITMRLAEAAGVRRQLDERQRRRLTLLAHFGYGTSVGSLFGLIAPRRPAAAVGAGVAYGLAVWAGSYLGLLPALHILTPATEHPARRSGVMIAAHVVWGATLGAMASAFRNDGGRR